MKTLATKSEIFKAAHKLTKETRKATDSYSATFSICLKYIYSQLKNSVMEQVEVKKVETFELETGYNKALKPCTYKQIEYLRTFDNVTIKTSSSQMLKRLNVWELSEAIDKAKEGVEVTIY